MTPRLSILLPVFDGAPYLGAQLGSILAQGDDDFELLAVDDGSSDGSAAILARHAAQDRRVRVVAATGNLGQRTRLRQLLGEARGRFVAFADQDDVWDAERDARLLAAIGDRPLAFGRSDLIDAAGAPLGRTLLDTLGLTPDPAMRLRALFKPLVSAHAAIWRRDWVDPAVFGHPMPFDWLLGTAALHGGGAVYVDDAVVRHRLHGANQMNRAAPDAKRRFSQVRNRYAYLLRRPGQLRLWLILDFLAGTAMMTADGRRICAELGSALRRGWFGIPNLRWSDDALRHLLLDRLSPLAGSPDDLAVARHQIDLLTRSLIHPAKLTAALRRAATAVEAEF